MAEDIASSDGTSEEESEEGESEEGEKWIVPDGYLSQDERTEEEGETVQCEEFVLKPSVILESQDTLLVPLRGFSLSNTEFPICCEIPEGKESAPGPMLNMEDLRKIVTENPYKKDQIIIAYKTLHPNTRKSDIRKAIETYFLKEERKGSKRRYIYKEDLPSKPPVFLIIKT